MKTNSNFNELLSKSDYNWYLELIKGDIVASKLSYEKKEELITKAIAQSESFKLKLISEVGIKTPFIYLTEYKIPVLYVQEKETFGFQYLGYYRSKNNSIVVNMTTVNSITSKITKLNCDTINKNDLVPLILMHELFHYLELTQKDAYSNQKHIKHKLFGIFNSKVKLNIVSEIAAIHFSKIMVDINYSPVIFRYLYNLKN